MLRNREEAGRLLADRLDFYREDPSGLVLALPRGGVVVGAVIAQRLRLPLDVIIVRKLGAPGCPEYALGAVSETGSVFMNDEALAEFPLSDRELEALIASQRGEIARQQALYRKGRPLPSLEGRAVILVDDGIATGATFSAAAAAIKSARAGRLIAAIPVGPQDSLGRISRLVDELVVLAMPEPFHAVGQHYLDFSQVDDDEVLRALAQSPAVGSKPNPGVA